MLCKASFEFCPGRCPFKTFSMTLRLSNGSAHYKMKIGLPSKRWNYRPAKALTQLTWVARLVSVSSCCWVWESLPSRHDTMVSLLCRSWEIFSRFRSSSWHVSAMDWLSRLRDACAFFSSSVFLICFGNQNKVTFLEELIFLWILSSKTKLLRDQRPVHTSSEAYLTWIWHHNSLTWCYRKPFYISQLSFRSTIRKWVKQSWTAANYLLQTCEVNICFAFEGSMNRAEYFECFNIRNTITH